jgi:hypothetical protein
MDPEQLFIIISGSDGNAFLVLNIFYFQNNLK